MADKKNDAKKTPDKKGGLGRGIGSLLPDASKTSSPIDVFFGGATSAAPVTQLMTVPGLTLLEIKLEDITPNSKQPRNEFEEEAMSELSHSIRDFGVLEPIVVRSLPGATGKYELIMGERRWRASRLAGKTTIPAVVRETADENMLRDALLENLHRANLNALEEASAYQQLMADFGITQEELSKKIGRSRPQISNTIRLLQLPDAIKLKVAGGALSAGQARAILGARNEERMAYWADQAIKQNLTVRNLEEQIAIDGGGASKRAGKVTFGTKQHGLDELAKRLGDSLDTKATIKLGKKAGEIKIQFVSLEDLFRIFDKLGVDRKL